jgi:hypothetical protein
MYLKVDEEDVEVKVLCNKCRENIHVYKKYESGDDTLTVHIGRCDWCEDGD